MQSFVNAFAAITLFVLATLAVRWVWHKIPHHASHESNILTRLSEINLSMQTQNKLLAEIAANVSKVNTNPCPTLDSQELIAGIREIMGRPRADVQGVITKLDEMEISLTKQGAKRLEVLDVIVETLDKNAKEQRAMLRNIFNSGTITSMDDATGADAERIEAMMRRYGLSLEEARERVRSSSVYEPMSGRA